MRAPGPGPGTGHVLLRRPGPAGRRPPTGPPWRGVKHPQCGAVKGGSGTPERAGRAGLQRNRPVADGAPQAMHACTKPRQEAALGKFQSPPDLVVKFQPLDIVDVILRLVLRLRRRQKITGRCWLCDRHRIHSLMMLHNTKIGYLFIYSSCAPCINGKPRAELPSA